MLTPVGSVGGVGETLFIIVAAAARRDPLIRSALSLQCRRSEERGGRWSGEQAKVCCWVWDRWCRSVDLGFGSVNGSSSSVFLCCIYLAWFEHQNYARVYLENSA